MLARVGGARHVALVVPDAVAKVSLVRFDQVPAKAADLDAMLRWNVRKSLPFKTEDAQVTYGDGVPVDGEGASSSSPRPAATHRRVRGRLHRRPARMRDWWTWRPFNLVNLQLASAVWRRRLAARAPGRSTTSRWRSSVTAR